MTGREPCDITFPNLDEPDVVRLAEILALKLRAGDVVALRGDLGAGKTTFARAVIRAVLDDAFAEVPSPTFAIEQRYRASRLELLHHDWYRLGGADDLSEIGFEDALATAAALVEWPERAEAVLPADRFEIHLVEAAADPELRDVRIVGVGAAASRARRIADLMTAYSAARPALRPSAIRFLAGDASARSYGRARAADGGHLVLMDSPAMPDGPAIADGLPYSRIAHIAETVRPFVAVSHALRAAGIAAPAVLHADLDRGALVLEDLGTLVFDAQSRAGVDQAPLWSAAVDALVALRAADPAPQITVPLPDGARLEHVLPRFDARALTAELSLLVDWAVPGAATAEARAAFHAAWAPAIEWLGHQPPGWTLRDYHSPNLVWRPERAGIDRVGVLDFQDAVLGHWAYDLVSLLQDARVDVPAALEAELLDSYCAAVSGADPGFDAQSFRRAYAIYGAQRATKIIGIFHRLDRRDGKPAYLAHLPRVWAYLARDLADPVLASVREWHDRHFPLQN